jgi:methionyl-tRNA formyltransferase
VRLIFLGTPEFAVLSLHALHEAGHEIALVVTRPDKPRGRSARPLPTPVKELALQLGLDVYEPLRASARASVARLRSLQAELGVVVAFGEILTPRLLASTERGFINLHASLLPDYRGAAPVSWALMRGEAVTGVSVIRVVPELDAGPILAQRRVAVGADETAGELEARLANAGAEAVADVVALMACEEAPGKPQPPGSAFFARKLTKEDGRIDWSLSAEEIRNRLRGVTPWPGAFCNLEAGGEIRRVALLHAETVDRMAEPHPAEPGTVIKADAEGIVVQAGTGLLRIKQLKRAGGRAMSAADFVHGRHAKAGDRFL